MSTPLERLKLLINSSTPIVVIETMEEMRAVGLVRTSCADLNLAVFEWSIADGLMRCGSNFIRQFPAFGPIELQMRIRTRVRLRPDQNRQPPGTAITTPRDPVQALANLETMTVEAVFILKDFHRHMENPVVVRRLRDVGQKFSANRRTLVLTAPFITMPGELVSLVEYLDLPLPDSERLRQIIEETFKQVAGKPTPCSSGSIPPSVDAMAKRTHCAG